MELYDILLAKKLGGGGGVTPTGTKSITANGTYDVASYASASVNVPGIVPSGTYNITENGTYNVTNYASASVSVTAPAVNIQALSITENGTYTASGSVDGYSPVTVNVSGGGDDRLTTFLAGSYTSFVDNSISNLCPFAFYSHRELSYVGMNNITLAPSSCFAYCSITSASFEKLTQAGSGAFYYCGSLTSIYAPSMSIARSQAFQYCKKLTEVPTALTMLYGSAFAGCSGLKSVNLTSVSIMSDYAFGECWSISKANINFNNTSMRQSAFYSDTALEDVVLSGTLTRIDNYAFRGCYKLLSLNLTGLSSVPTLGGNSVFHSTPISGYTASTGGVYGSIYVPASLYNSYLTATYWSALSARIVSV